MANQRQRAKTASICTAETEESSHIFRISGYSHHIGLGVGRYISSTIFFVGGHGWRIRYFPEGEDREACEDFVAVYLDLVSVVATVRFKYNLKLVNKTTGESSSIFFSPNVLTAESPSSWGTNRFMKKSEIESTYMSDESVEIECDVTVIMESRLREIPIPSYFDFHVPPSNLSDDLHKLFESEEGVDITFKVKNEFFRAHKILLAIRSPVFKQQFYESLKVKRMESRTVDGMDPKVFKALLYFIYTDSLPTMSDLSEDEKRERIKKLFAVAHEYGMERMKLECGKILCDNLNVGNAFSTLALADEYKCQMLKDACIQFTIFSKRRMGDVLRSQGFEPFKETHSKVAVELWQSDSPDFFERRAFNIGLMNQDSSDEPRDNHRNSDSGREQRGALPVLHWLASSLPLICDLGCLQWTSI